MSNPLLDNIPTPWDLIAGRTIKVSNDALVSDIYTSNGERISTKTISATQLVPASYYLRVCDVLRQIRAVVPKCTHFNYNRRRLQKVIGIVSAELTLARYIKLTSVPINPQVQTLLLNIFASYHEFALLTTDNAECSRPPTNAEYTIEDIYDKADHPIMGLLKQLVQWEVTQVNCDHRGKLLSAAEFQAKSLEEQNACTMTAVLSISTLGVPSWYQRRFLSVGASIVVLAKNGWNKSSHHHDFSELKSSVKNGTIASALNDLGVLKYFGNQQMQTLLHHSTHLATPIGGLIPFMWTRIEQGGIPPSIKPNEKFFSLLDSGGGILCKSTTGFTMIANEDPTNEEHKAVKTRFRKQFGICILGESEKLRATALGVGFARYNNAEKVLRALLSNYFLCSKLTNDSIADLMKAITYGREIKKENFRYGGNSGFLVDNAILECKDESNIRGLDILAVYLSKCGQHLSYASEKCWRLKSNNTAPHAFVQACEQWYNAQRAQLYEHTELTRQLPQSEMFLQLQQFVGCAQQEINEASAYFRSIEGNEKHNEVGNAIDKAPKKRPHDLSEEQQLKKPKTTLQRSEARGEEPMDVAENFDEQGTSGGQ